VKSALTAFVVSLVASLMVLPAVGGAAEPASTDHPLLDLARELQKKRKPDLRIAPGAPELREAEHALAQSKAPADAECAGSIGASRFADLHIDVALARTAQGDFAGAATAYRSAHACRPRDALTLSALSGALFDARDYAGAREAIDASLAIEPRAVNANRLAGQIDFIEERWAAATARFRYVASSDLDRVQASYGQLMYWLSQMRAGVPKPEMVERKPAEGWPQPLLLYMQGQYTEAELTAPIRQGDDEDNTQPQTTTDERLCEALFYVGEAYWARGQPDVARDYFAALVNIKVIYFLEHGLALAEIAKLRK
jgi:lipoprotein NlpI